MTRTGTATADHQTPPSRRTPGWLVRPVLAAERSSKLDRPVAVLDGLGRRLPAAAHDRLRGDWLGHALHPLLTDFPLGSWMSASLLDLVGGEQSRPAATRLVGFGLAMSVPTVASGLAEWATAGRPSRRVGVVHAAANTLTTALYGASLAARLGGRHRLGVATGLVGGLTAWVGGYLGGHLSIVRKLGSADPSFGRPST